VAYAIPGAIGFSIGMSLAMHEVSIIRFDLGMVLGVMLAVLLRWLILPLFARRRLFPERKDVTLVLEAIVLFAFGLIIILVTELTRILI